MKAAPAAYLLALIATASCSLLEMSQTLWTKAVEGGLTKIGALDPLRIPIVKVDQSEGNTSYRMILRSVEIRGLNASSLESIHIGRGRLKTNLSEHEAGYVSYSDQHEIDMIRYRFHTVIKEPKMEESQNFEAKSYPGADKSEGQKRSYNHALNNHGNYEASLRYRDDREKVLPQGQRMDQGSFSRDQNDRSKVYEQHSNYETSSRQQDGMRHYTPSQNYQAQQAQFSGFTSKIPSYQAHSQNSEDLQKLPVRVRYVYPENRRYPGGNYRTTDGRFVTESSVSSGCIGNCEYRGHPYNLPTSNDQRSSDTKNKQEDDVGTAASSNFETRRTYLNARINSRENVQNSVRGQSRNDESKNDNRYATTFDEKFDRTNNNQRKYDDLVEVSSPQRLENQPGYVDIVYADGKDHKMKHFGNLRVEPGRDKTVYSFDDILKDLHHRNRFIVHNFTEGEALTKKNDAVRIASETKRIKDLVRYAKDFQEKNGYYEQEMHLIYHFGGLDDDANIDDKEGKRIKRAHLDDENDDDVMHVIMKIRVPMLQVDAGYVLMGKVGKQALRGTGLLSANFTELIGDFTLEFKKVDRDTMIVRAARARLSASDKKITLQGMDEEGPVHEILTRGLMAAEAVAAMLADDLTTKALSEKTADSIIYKMYKNLPPEK